MGLINKAAAWLAKKGMGVPAFWFQRGIELGSQEVLSEPYKSSVWVQSAIAKIAGPIASVEPCLYRPDRELAGTKGGRGLSGGGRGGRGAFGRKAMGDEIDVPTFQDFLREPMAGLGYSDFVEASVGCLQTRRRFLTCSVWSKIYLSQQGCRCRVFILLLMWHQMPLRLAATKNTLLLRSLAAYSTCFPKSNSKA